MSSPAFQLANVEQVTALAQKAGFARVEAEEIRVTLSWSVEEFAFQAWDIIRNKLQPNQHEECQSLVRQDLESQKDAKGNVSFSSVAVAFSLFKQ